MLQNLTRIAFNTFSSCSGAQPEIFKDRGGFAELKHFGKPFVNNARKQAGKNFRAFSPRFKLHFEWKI